MGAGIKRAAGGRRHRPMGEINVTPFVDVMLVLLIVFMVTAPLLTVGVEVDLPKTRAGAINADAAPLVMVVVVVLGVDATAREMASCLPFLLVLWR